MNLNLLLAGTLCIPTFWSVAQSSSDAPADAPTLAPGHSYHGEAFNEGPRQAASLMAGMPDLHFPITTTNALAQRFFTQGIGQLHGFWYFEAERSFRQARTHDTNCAMAYWGMAMANINNPKRALKFTKIASQKKELADRREQLWIDSLSDYYGKTNQDERTRRREYVRALERIIYEYPDDIEAKAFLAFQIWNNSSKGLPITSAQAVESLLKEVFAAHPMHPAHHYRIHLWDGEKEEMSVRALPSAARCGQSAPGIAHMWHMPGHTFSKLKRYHDVAWQQEAAVRVDNAQLIRNRLLPDQIHNYAHNSEWLCQTYGRIGRVHAAIDLAKNMIEMPHHPRYNTMEKKEDNIIYEKSSGTAFHGRRRLIEELLRYELWDELIDACNSPYLAPTDIAEEQARRAHALGVSWFAKDRPDQGTNQIAALDAALKLMRSERQAVLEKAEDKAKQAKKSKTEINRAMLDALNSFDRRLESIENYAAELKLYSALAQDLQEDAKKQIDSLKHLSKERRSAIYLQLGDTNKSEQLALDAYKAGTNQVQLIAHYADVLWRNGKTNAAVNIFQVLRARSSALELDLPVFQRLSPIAQHMELSSDWRVAENPSLDSGIRPDINTLGPIFWTPQPAPNWTLTDASGKERALSDYRGRPVILIFYLGHGCLHCLEQLDIFAPMADAFADAGISLLGVSTDSADGLNKTLERVKDQKEFPFPLVADPSLEVFKTYRAYDDFEQMPLHGTFLIDAEGLVRWQDISFEPFTETKFLLSEATRLLSLTSKQNVARSFP